MKYIYTLLIVLILTTSVLAVQTGARYGQKISFNKLQGAAVTNLQETKPKLGAVLGLNRASRFYYREALFLRATHLDCGRRAATASSLVRHTAERAACRSAAGKPARLPRPQPLRQ